MFADPRKVALRRLERRIKASASIVLALAAGAFLACHRDAPRGAPASGGGSGPAAPGAGDSGVSTGGVEAGSAASDASATGDAGAASATDAGTALAQTDAHTADSALAVRDAGRGHRVDRHEHRTGMPVRDNLLE